MYSTVQRPAILLLALAVALQAGCNAPKAPSASVSGNVTSDGMPFEGKIVFMPGGSSTESAMVEVLVQGGKYEVSSLPPGTKAINVFAAPAPDDPNQKSNRQNGFWVAEPRSVEIHAGSQTFDFAVTRMAP